MIRSYPLPIGRFGLGTSCSLEQTDNRLLTTDDYDYDFARI